jgi:hypothetical protein
MQLTWQGEPLNIDRHANLDADDGGLQVTLMRHWADELRSDGVDGKQHVLVVYVDDR